MILGQFNEGLGGVKWGRVGLRGSMGGGYIVGCTLFRVALSLRNSQRSLEGMMDVSLVLKSISGPYILFSVLNMVNCLSHDFTVFLNLL